MEYRWNLDALYKGFDDPAFSADSGRKGKVKLRRSISAAP